MTPNVKSISEKKNKFAKWPQHRNEFQACYISHDYKNKEICQEDIHIDIDMDDH